MAGEPVDYPRAIVPNPWKKNAAVFVLLATMSFSFYKGVLFYFTTYDVEDEGEVPQYSLLNHVVQTPDRRSSVQYVMYQSVRLMVPVECKGSVDPKISVEGFAKEFLQHLPSHLPVSYWQAPSKALTDSVADSNFVKGDKYGSMEVIARTANSILFKQPSNS